MKIIACSPVLVASPGIKIVFSSKFIHSQRSLNNNRTDKPAESWRLFFNKKDLFPRYFSYQLVDFFKRHNLPCHFHETKGIEEIEKADEETFSEIDNDVLKNKLLLYEPVMLRFPDPPNIS